MSKLKISKSFVYTGLIIVLSKFLYNIYVALNHKIDFIELMFSFLIYSYIILFAFMILKSEYKK